MTKKMLIAGIVIVVVVAALGGYLLLSQKVGQGSQKVYRVGVLSGLNVFATTTDGFKEKMTELGYVEGKNVIYDVQKTDLDMNKYKSILTKFVADKVDLIFVFPTEATIMAKTVTKGTIPVVFANAFTEDTGLVNSVREPGGNITGVRWPGPDMALQRLEIMRELVPQAKRIWVPYQKGYPIVNSQLAALRTAFVAAGLTMTEIPADNAAGLEIALKKQAQLAAFPDAILTIAEPLCVTPDSFEVMAKFAQEHRIPLGGAYLSVDGYESVFGLMPQSVPQGQQAAVLADKILRGIPAGTIPVVSAENYFQLNYRAASKLGLTVSEGLLSRANEVIR